MFREIKPPFGQTNPVTSFGGGFSAGTTTSPFGQSFGNKTTTGFPTPAFGSTGNSLFGSTTSTSGNLFGGASAAPVFGQAQTTQPSAFGFPSSTTGSNLFGNQQNANTGLFGSAGTSAFGSANKPAFGGFGTGTGTGLFGQQQQPQATQQTPSLFGQSAGTTSTGIFGSGGFGAANTTTAAVGTPIKFTPVTGTDTMVKNGVSQTINTRHHCITCMKEYESKSLEELRLEDYMANRKGPQQGTQQTGLFGSTSGGSLFGSGPSTSTGTGGIFTENKPLFGGGTSMGFGSSTGGVFGSTSQAPGGLFGKSGFGTMTTTTGGTGTGFSFNTATTANPFGASTQAKPFGSTAPQSTGLFGATTQPSAFGTQSTGFSGFGTPPNQSIGLFGQNKTPFSTATTNAGFSFGQNTATNPGGLFAAKPAGTTGFGTNAFGTPAQPTFGSGNMFGNNQNTSLFNQPFKPATSSFSFGQQAPTTTLGGGMNLGGQSLFGSTTNKPGGLFGNTTGMFNSGTFGGGSTFGTGGALGSSLSLTGNPLTGTTMSPTQQNSTSVHQQILALASMPFGDSPLFRNLLPATGKADELLKPTNPASQKAVGSNSFKVSPRGTAKIKVKPLGVSSLSKKSLFEGLEEPDPSSIDTFQPRFSTKRLMLKPKTPTASPAQQSTAGINSPADQTETQDSDKENADIRTNVLLPQTSEDSWLTKSMINSPGESNKDHDLSESLTGSPLIRTNTLPSSSRRNDDSSVENTVTELRRTSEGHNSVNADDKELSNNSSSSDDSLEVDEPAAVMENQESHPTGIVLRRVGYYTIPSMDELPLLMGDDGSCVVDNFTVGREGYGNVFFPGPIDVAQLNLDEIVHFRHKEVTVYPDDDKKPPVGQGLNRRAQVTLDRVWPHDKTTHSPITDPERLKQIDYESKLRRVCAKLNTRFLEFRPQTGSWVFKVDHFSKYGISDSDEEDVPASDAKKLKPTGTFLQQGHLQALQQQQQQKQQLKPKADKLSSSKELPHGLSDGLLTNDLGQHTRELVPVLLEDDQDMEEGIRRQMGMFDNDEELEKLQQSPSMELAREIGSPTHKVQLMKASFFMGDVEEDLDSEYMDFEQYPSQRLLRIDADDYMEEADSEKAIITTPKLSKSFAVFRTHFTAPEASLSQTPISIKGSQEADEVAQARPRLQKPSGPWIPPPKVQPKIVVLRHRGEIVPFSKSIVGRMSARCLAETGLVMGRSFRTGWGVDSTLLTLNTQKAAAVVPLKAELADLSIFTSGRADGDCSQCIVQRLRICGGGVDSASSFMESIEGHLKIQLRHSDKGDLEANCPLFEPSLGVDALHGHCALADQLNEEHSTDPLTSYYSKVWNLCVALWGSLPDLDTDSGSHKTEMLRREAVSEWLEDVVQQKVREETAALRDAPSQDKESHIPVVLSLLTGRNILEACVETQEAGDQYISLLLAQLGGGPATKQLMQRQLTNWQDVQADSFINRDRLKLMMLVAGIPLFQATDDTVNVCENLDWVRAFAIHLWYMCSPVASVTDALLQYEKAFGADGSTEMYAHCPDPPYIEEGMAVETNSGLPVRDLCFHLLKLFSSRAHPLAQLLNPATHTSDPLDYRLSWLLLQVLHGLGYSHISEYSAAVIHTSFASQLESHGLWHWAIFVLLHIKNPFSREGAVLDMLGRHVEISENQEYLDKEQFLCDQLSIPSHWIFEAKATLALACKRYKEAAYYLIKAGLWNKSHDVIMQYIAADAIVNENYGYLHDLLEALVPAERSSTIAGWNNKGQLLWDYLKIVTEVETLLADQNVSLGYQLEKLQPQLSSLCARINMLPCPTAVDRLCQSEIAKRTVHIVRNVLLLQKGEHGVSPRVLANLVTQLPLPEDYALQELRQVVSSCIAEFTPPLS